MREINRQTQQNHRTNVSKPIINSPQLWLPTWRCFHWFYRENFQIENESLVPVACFVHDVLEVVLHDTHWRNEEMKKHCVMSCERCVLLWSPSMNNQITFHETLDCSHLAWIWPYPPGFSCFQNQIHFHLTLNQHQNGNHMCQSSIYSIRSPYPFIPGKLEWSFFLLNSSSLKNNPARIFLLFCDSFSVSWIILALNCSSASKCCHWDILFNMRRKTNKNDAPSPTTNNNHKQ